MDTGERPDEVTGEGRPQDLARGAAMLAGMDIPGPCKPRLMRSLALSAAAASLALAKLADEVASALVAWRGTLPVRERITAAHLAAMRGMPPPPPPDAANPRLIAGMEDPPRQP